MFLGMRTVMDIGGSCAEGGPYVDRAALSRRGPFPRRSAGIFGLFAVRCDRHGDTACRSAASGRPAPLLGWSALFASLGWNFMDYGLFNPPEGTGSRSGW